MKKDIFYGIISYIYDWIATLIDNPITKSFAFFLLVLPTYFYVVLPLLIKLDLTSGDYDYIQQFIQWLGIPYGLLLALVLVNVWAQFEAANRAFAQEANTILALHSTFLLISNKKIKEDAKTNILKYVTHVHSCYFEEYKDQENKLKIEGDDFLNNIRKSIENLIRKREKDVLTTELLRLLNKLIDNRWHRLACSKQRMPQPVLILSIIASGLWLVPFLVLLRLSNFILGVFLFGGITLVVVSIILMVIDLDNPIGGTWGIEFNAWDELLLRIEG